MKVARSSPTWSGSNIKKCNSAALAKKDWADQNEQVKLKLLNDCKYRSCAGDWNGHRPRGHQCKTNTNSKGWWWQNISGKPLGLCSVRGKSLELWFTSLQKCRCCSVYEKQIINATCGCRSWVTEAKWVVEIHFASSFERQMQPLGVHLLNVPAWAAESRFCSFPGTWAPFQCVTPDSAPVCSQVPTPRCGLKSQKELIPWFGVNANPCLSSAKFPWNKQEGQFKPAERSLQ